MKKEWFTAASLAGQIGMPSLATNVTRKARSLNWKCRQIKGARGVSFEYHVSSLPLETQAALGVQNVSLLDEAEVDGSDMLTIQIYSAKNESWSKIKPFSRMELPKIYLSKFLPEVDFGQLIAFEALDGTMQPTIRSGEILLVSKISNNSSFSSGVFVIETILGVMIRRLKPNLAGTEVRVCCDAEQFDEEVLSRKDFNKSIKLLGRVVGVVVRNII